MISYRQADLAHKINEKANETIRNNAILWFNKTIKGHHVYEHNFEDIQVGDATYAGILQVVFDAKFIKGTNGNLEEPDEPNTYEIAILNYIILPGDIQNEDGIKIYEMDILAYLKNDIVEMIDESMLEQDIEESLHQRDRESD